MLVPESIIKLMVDKGGISYEQVLHVVTLLHALYLCVYLFEDVTESIKPLVISVVTQHKCDDHFVGR